MNRISAASTGDARADLLRLYDAALPQVYGYLLRRWGLNSPLATASVRRTYRRGDVGYVSLWTPDAARAADFYADVLGWVVCANAATRSSARPRLPVC